MKIPVLTAVTGARWETELVVALEQQAAGLRVVRRCVDLADLLATAASGTARAALLAADLRRLDQDTVIRLADSGVAVLGLFTPGEEEAADRLRRLGIGIVLSADAGIDRITAAVAESVAALGPPAAGRRRGYAHGPVPPGGSVGGDGGATAGNGPSVDKRFGGDGPSRSDGRSARDRPPRRDPAVAGAASGREATGLLVAVWGPTGAPGRTMLAVTLAGELMARGIETLLADADVYGGVIAQVLGLLDESPGLAAAARLANSGTLDPVALARVARAIAPGLRVLTGISRAERWPELRPAAVLDVWASARLLAGVTVVDTAFNLEEDEEIAFDTAAPRRNGLTLATLEAADVVYAVGAADPVGLQRLIRGLARLREVVPGACTRVVLNQVRRGPIGAQPERQLAGVLARYAGVVEVDFIPYDREGLDTALATGRTLAEVAPDSPARLAVARLAAELVDMLEPLPHRGGTRRRRRVRAEAPMRH
jgi:MinD-like ATPase involved in chromosome partitioning or flagellar assembly